MNELYENEMKLEFVSKSNNQIVLINNDIYHFY